MILFENRAAEVLYKTLTKIQNKKFLLPLNVCPIVPDTFLKANKEFEFIDIDLETLCMDNSSALQRIDEDNEIDGILFVKTFGVEFDIQPFYRKIKDMNRNIFIIDDMCPCVPEFEHVIEKSYADLTLFSTGYSKYVDIGYGGYGFLRDNDFTGKFFDKDKGIEFFKYKNIVMEAIPKVRKHKQELNTIYKDNLPEELFLGDKFNNWRFSLLVDRKDVILERIFEVDGLFASSHYPQVDFQYSKNPIPNSNTQAIHNRIVNLFNDFRFSKDQAYQTSRVIMGCL